jgi:MFS family permease
VFFLFFIDTLNISILPNYFEDIAQINNIDKTHIKYLFSIYFLSFVLSFFPTSLLIKRFGTKVIFALALFFLFMGAFLLYISTDFYVVAIARVFSGIAFGMTLVTTESHLLESLPVQKRQLISATTGMLYSAAIICGAVLGSLAFTAFDVSSLFLLEMFLVVSTSIYFLIFIENRKVQKEEKPTLPFYDKVRLLIDWHFFKNVFLAGFFSKVTLSSVIFFTFPLILVNYEYSQSQIGQIIIFYSIGILAGGIYISKYKATNSFHKPIAIGLAISGISMINIGFCDFLYGDKLLTISLIGSMLFLGFAHSLISAYLLPSIFNFNITKQVGISNIRPLVLLCERGGNIFGPIVITELFLLLGFNLLPIMVLGVISLVFSAIFLLA